MLACCSISYDDGLMLQIFVHSLEGSMLDWYYNLPRDSIRDLKTIAKLFVKHFSRNVGERVTLSDLYSPKENADESLAN